jgi:deoxyhypusine synthase
LLHVRHNQLGTGGASISYTIRVNGVATLLTVTALAIAAGGADLVDVVAVAQGDYVDVEVVVTGGGNLPKDITASVALN